MSEPVTSTDFSSATKAEIEGSIFEIGGEDQLAKLRREATTVNGDDEEPVIAEKWGQFLQDARVRVGTLLKTENVAFLLGAGASKQAGGPLLGAIPLELEAQLHEKGVSGNRVRAWLRLFFCAAAKLARPGSPAVPTDRTEILSRRALVQSVLGAGVSETSKLAIQVNFEALLSLLYRWRSALTDEGSRLRIDGTPPVVADTQTLDECINKATASLAQCCKLPATEQEGLVTHVQFIKKLLTRPLNLRRVNIFTLNYDTLIEQGADAVGAVLLDGFVGTVNRVFRPESYDQDLYFPAETTEGRVHRFDRVLHLCKLHGSITWRLESSSEENPYGIVFSEMQEQSLERLLVYPTPAKFGETLGMPYAELFRRFAASVARPQSTLFVIGYGFGDDHVNAIIWQALAIPTFTLVVVDPFPSPASASAMGFIARLRAQFDRRFWLFGGQRLGVFSSFVSDLLPDLRDEEIERRVLETRRALDNRTQAGT